MALWDQRGHSGVSGFVVRGVGVVAFVVGNQCDAKRLQGQA